MGPEKGAKAHEEALEGLRKEIDRIDGRIVPLLARRQDVSAEIGKVKAALGMAVFSPEREQSVLRGIVSLGGGNLPGKALRCIYREILSASRSVQGPVTVAFLGPEGTFSHQAAVSLFGRSASFRPAGSIEEVFAQVEKGRCTRGVVPIENSCEGAVNRTMDLLYDYPLRISSEIFLRIRHHLLSKAAEYGRVRRIYSHPMALAQCRRWIERHLPGVPVMETGSTSEAARKAAEEAGTAAVGGRLCAGIYGLRIAAANIEDRARNVTRFLCVSQEEPAPTGNDKTSILFSLKHAPGALQAALEVLARNRINMTRIESRPQKSADWEYVFFVDMEGHQQEDPLARALDEMAERCAFMKRLGSYPAGGDPWDS